MKNILVPTDLSPIANLGLKLAVQIAIGTEAVIKLVNFTKHPISMTFTAMGDINTKVDDDEQRYILELLRANKAKLEDLMEQYKGQAKIEYSIEDGEFKNGLDEYLKREQVDLIVMGTSGEANLREMFTGNHVEQAIQVSTCPVISVRDGFSISSFRNIIVAISCLDAEKIKNGLSHLYQLGKIFNSTVHLVHVIDTASDSNKDMDDLLSNLAVNNLLVPYTVNLLEGDDAVEAVMKFARETRAGLIAVIKDSPGSSLKIFSNHFTDRIVKEEGRPVFTVNPKTTH